MVRLLIRTAIFFASAGIGLIVASWVVTGFSITLTGFILATVVFAVAQSVLTPFAMKMAHRHAPRLLGGIGLVSTFLALVVASFVPGGISIRGITAWILGTLVVWLATALGTWLLPLAVLKQARSGSGSE